MKRISILLAQDDDGNREVASEILSAEGWDVVATAGPLTLEVVRAHAPQVIVLDGHDAVFLRELRTASVFSATPVVLWTALAVAADAVAEMERDFAPLAVVQKPSMLPELPDAIRRLLARATGSDPSTDVSVPPA